MVNNLVRGCVALLCATGALSAHAALPDLSLTFRDQHAVVDPGDAIEVWVTLTNQGSTAFNFDGSLYPFGLAPGDLPTEGVALDPGTGEYIPAPFAAITGAITISGTDCETNQFTNGCAGDGPYTFNINEAGEDGGPSINFLTALSLAPGASQDYLLGILTPSNPPVPQGLYSLSTVGFGLQLSGLGFDGAAVTAALELSVTCSPQTDTCAFTRQVGPIPEPESYGLALAGLMVTGAVLARQRQRKETA